MGNGRNRETCRLYSSRAREDIVFMECAHARLCSFVYNIGGGRNIGYGGNSISDRHLFKQKGPVLNNLFIERSIKSAIGFFKEAVFSEDIARSGGLLQSIDPRIKTALLIIFIAAACFANTWTSLLGLYAVSMLLALSSKIDLVYFVKRVWFFIPIFTLFIAIPAIFVQGFAHAVIFVLRVTACVSFVVVFTITTRHAQLLKSFEAIGVPPIFVQVLDMTYRYVFLFLKIFEDMHVSLKSRIIETFSHQEARRWIASRIAFLFKRSVRMSEEVYMAMLARGYGMDDKKHGK